MIETFSALFAAHILADFVLQNNAIAEGKQVRKPLPLALHIIIVYLTAAACMGLPWSPWIAGLAGAHMIIDVAKSFLPKGKLWPFLADQVAHLGSLVVITIGAPDLWDAGYWASYDIVPPIMVLVAGLVAATRAGGFAVGLLLNQVADTNADTTLPKGGRIIGLLERGLIFGLVVVGQPAGIGFLIAAKSVLRFDSIKSGRSNAASEYVIIGTLASFGWAMVIAWGTLAILNHLPSLGIPEL